MNQIKYTEIFYTVQGEGLHTGCPSVFLRTFGCNFRCQGFGMPKGEISDEYLTIDVHDAKTIKDLPLVKTGCDSYPSWDPRCKHLAHRAEVDDIVPLLLAPTPNKCFRTPHDTDIDLVFTGGEPLLGWQKLYPEILRQLIDYGLRNVTFETNGTQLLDEKFRNFLSSKTGRQLNVTFSVSPKLSVSGEPWKKAIQPPVVKSYLSYGEVVLKFVVQNEKDVAEVEKALNAYSLLHPKVYCMPVGGLKEDYQGNAKKVAELCMKKGFRYSPRLHCDLFGNNWGT